MMEKAGIDRLAAFHLAIDIVRRGGTISIIGVYGGMIDPLPMLTLFDKQIQLRMGQANVKRWVDDIMPLLAVTTTRSASTTSPPIASRWSRRPRPTRCSRRRPTARSRSCSSPELRRVTGPIVTGLLSRHQPPGRSSWKTASASSA